MSKTRLLIIPTLVMAAGDFAVSWWSVDGDEYTRSFSHTTRHPRLQARSIHPPTHGHRLATIIKKLPGTFEVLGSSEMVKD